MPASSTNQFEVLAISASSPDERVACVLLWKEAKRGGSLCSGGTPAVFPRRHGSPSRSDPAVNREPLELAGETLDEPGNAQSQLLSATSSGLWIDEAAQLARPRNAVLYCGGRRERRDALNGSWCKAAAGAPCAMPKAKKDTRSYFPAAIADRLLAKLCLVGIGQRGGTIVTGAGGRADAAFSGRQLVQPRQLSRWRSRRKRGARYGAAFSTSEDGWLGKGKLPVHLTTAANAVPSRLRPWPVPFRSADGARPRARRRGRRRSERSARGRRQR